MPAHGHRRYALSLVVSVALAIIRYRYYVTFTRWKLLAPSLSQTAH